MHTRPETGQVRGAWHRWLLCPLIALCALGGAAVAGAPAPAAAPAKTTYTVIQLSSTFSFASINAKGQVAFTEEVGGVNRAKYYDGKVVRDIGTLGGPSATATDVNDLGQVTGSATLNADGSITHAYRWSQSTGMLDLSRKGQGNSQGNAINNKGEVTGSAVFDSSVSDTGHAFFWSPPTGMLDIGALGPFSSIGTEINDAGAVAGYSEGPTGGPFSVLVFRWTRAEGIRDIGTVPGEFTYPTDINAAGHIVGKSPFLPVGLPHAFLWTQKEGLIDLGAGSGRESTALAINDKDVVVGQTEIRFAGPQHGFIWTRETGLVEITAGSNSSANDVNNSNQVVGSFDDRAFVWTRAEGVVDLNTRIPGAPEGLRLIAATAISDNGSIVADANTGLVLLVPQCPCSTGAPVVSPIKMTGSPHVNVPLSFSATFKDGGVRDTHKATWSWGDGSKDAGTVNEKGGHGSVSGQHAYRSPGIYTVKLTVTDNTGKSTTVQRKVVICGSGHHLVGEGAFLSPLGASALAPDKAGVATFAVLSPVGNDMHSAQGTSGIEFNAAGISLRSGQIDSMSVRGGQVQYHGKGSVNGVAGYHFTLGTTTGGEAGKDRIRMRIWHYGPDAKTQVVDYDNLPRGAAADGAGTALVEGGISVESN